MHWSDSTAVQAVDVPIHILFIFLHIVENYSVSVIPVLHTDSGKTIMH